MPWAEKLPSGKWRAMYRDAGGKRRSAGTWPHKAAALREAGAKEEKARRTGRNPVNAKQTWGKWQEVWLAGRTVAASTAKRDESRRKMYLEPRWESVPLGSITRHEVRTWAADLAAQGVGPSSVRRIVHLFSASLAAAVDAEVIDVNPAARLKLPGGAKEQERYLTRAEYAALYEQMPTTQDRLIIETLFHTGLRWGELAGLHRGRVDFRRKVLRVVETYDEASGTIKPYPKGKRVREVPLTPELVKQFKALPATIGTCGVEHVAGKCPGGLIFTTPDQHRPLRNSNWAPTWRHAIEDAEIGHARIHDARHTYASWLLQAGVPLAEVGRLLGHVSTATTDKYAHLAETPSAAVLSALASGAKAKAKGKRAAKGGAL